MIEFYTRDSLYNEIIRSLCIYDLDGLHKPTFSRFPLSAEVVLDA